MPNMPKQPGDAVLSLDGTVKVNGAVVGVWRLGDWQGVMRMYYFALAEGQDPVVTNLFRHEFKAAIPEYLRSIGRLPDHGSDIAPLIAVESETTTLNAWLSNSRCTIIDGSAALPTATPNTALPANSTASLGIS